MKRRDISLNDYILNICITPRKPENNLKSYLIYVACFVNLNSVRSISGLDPHNLSSLNTGVIWFTSKANHALQPQKRQIGIFVRHFDSLYLLSTNRFEKKIASHRPQFDYKSTCSSEVMMLPWDTISASSDCNSWPPVPYCFVAQGFWVNQEFFSAQDTNRTMVFLNLVLVRSTLERSQQ